MPATSAATIFIAGMARSYCLLRMSQRTFVASLNI